MKDSIISQTSVLNCTNSMRIQNVCFSLRIPLFYYPSEMSDNDGTFSLAPRICCPPILISIKRKTIKWYELKRGILRAQETGLL